MAHQLAALGVDIIEAGFPIASKATWKPCWPWNGSAAMCRCAALARLLPGSIFLAAAEALKPANIPRAWHVFLATSDLHLQAKLH